MKTLTKIALGALAIIGVGCINNNEYHFNGKIDDEQVRFYERFSCEDMSFNNFLKVTKKDGTKIKYVDKLDNDLRLECVKITKDGKTKKCRGRHLLEEAQKQFDWYLDTISAINYQEFLDYTSK